MGWKTINGRQYYYRSVRQGGRVKSEYVGDGELAALVARWDEIERNHRRSLSEAEQVERDAERRWDRAFDDLVTVVREATAAVLEAAGFHRHKHGEWRRRRSGKGRDSVGTSAASGGDDVANEIETRPNRDGGPPDPAATVTATESDAPPVRVLAPTRLPYTTGTGTAG
jgi:hypothetical protein